MILRNLKSLIRRYPVAVVLNFTGLVAALLAFALIFLQADYELSFDKCHPTSGRVFRADKKGDESLFRNILPRGFADDIIGSSTHIEAGCTVMPFIGEIYFSVAENGKAPVGYKQNLILQYTFLTGALALSPSICNFVFDKSGFICYGREEKIKDNEDYLFCICHRVGYSWTD